MSSRRFDLMNRSKKQFSGFPVPNGCLRKFSLPYPEYVCATHIGIGGGPDAKFTIWQQDQAIWSASLTCPDGKEDTVTVNGGTYTLEVRADSGGDPGWGITIFQE